MQKYTCQQGFFPLKEDGLDQATIAKFTMMISALNISNSTIYPSPPPKNLVLLSVSALKTLGAGRFPNDTLFTDYTFLW